MAHLNTYTYVLLCNEDKNGQRSKHRDNYKRNSLYLFVLCKTNGHGSNVQQSHKYSAKYACIEYFTHIQFPQEAELLAANPLPTLSVFSAISVCLAISNMCVFLNCLSNGHFIRVMALSPNFICDTQKWIL